MFNYFFVLFFDGLLFREAANRIECAQPAWLPNTLKKVLEVDL